MLQNENKLHIKTITWSKDASQLIDYNDPNLYTSSFDISSNCKIVRVGNEVASVKEDNLKEEYQLLSSIKCIQGDYYYLSIIIKKDTLFDELMTGDHSWFVLRNSKLLENNQSTRYMINEGDMLKLGRIWLRIKKIKHDSHNMNTSYTNNDIYRSRVTEANKDEILKLTSSKIRNIEEKKGDENNEKKKKGDNQKEKSTRICRICYGEEADDDPLIQPCICSGTMKYIHISCIKQWLTSKLCVKSSLGKDCVAFVLSKIECELCKTTFPDYVKHKGELYELLDFPQSFENYIVFEKLTEDHHGNKFLYFVKFNENNQMNIGRGHEANLILEEISVSRIHCIISKIKKSFYIEDNNSKFGTLVLIQAPQVKVIQGLPLSVQIGRTNLQMTIKEPFKFFTCCGVTEYNSNNSYDRENLKFLDVNRGKVTREDDGKESEIEVEEENNLKIIVGEGDGNGEAYLKLDVTNKEEIEENYQKNIDSSTKRKNTMVVQDDHLDNNDNLDHHLQNKTN